MTVLCVDDHPILLEGLAQNVHLVEPDADIYCFSDAKEAMAHAEKYGCDVLFTEIDLYHFSGIQLAKWIRKKFPRQTSSLSPSVQSGSTPKRCCVCDPVAI